MHAFQGHRGFGGPAAPGGSALGNLFGTGLGGGARGGSAFGAFGGFGPHHHMMNAPPAPPSAFHHTYRAYSAAIFEIQHGRGNAGASVIDGGRAQVMFGGQSGSLSLLLFLVVIPILTPVSYLSSFF